MTGYVYLIGSRAFRWYKIGRSRNAAIRITELGILLPFSVEVIATWKVENSNRIEQLLHECCEPYRINGEWFSFNREVLDSILIRMRSCEVQCEVNFSNPQISSPVEEKAMKRLAASFGVLHEGTTFRKRVDKLTARNTELKNKVDALAEENKNLRALVESLTTPKTTGSE